MLQVHGPIIDGRSPCRFLERCLAIMFNLILSQDPVLLPSLEDLGFSLLQYRKCYSSGEFMP